MPSNLKPCPCCGHRAIELWQELSDYSYWYTIGCVDCGLTIEGSYRQKAIYAWQRRRTDGMIAWLDAEIDECRNTYCINNYQREKALRQCKQQLLKLLDGMGVE